MRDNPFLEFLRQERSRYNDIDNNRLAFAAGHASRYYDYLSLILTDYLNADKACRSDYARIADLGSIYPSGIPEEELERSSELRCRLLYEIESFYIMGKTLLDRIADLVLLYFGPVRECSLRSHHSFVDCRKEYFKGVGFEPSDKMFSIMDHLLERICEFRDKKITHQNNPRVHLGVVYPDSRGAYLNAGHLFPKPTDQAYQSKSLDELIKDIDMYVHEVLKLLTDRREFTVLKFENDEG